MTALKAIAGIIIIVYILVVILLFALQTKLIFYPGKLKKDYRFGLGPRDRELFIRAADGETINALYFGSTSDDVILYFHGNAGDLSGWQYVAQDFTTNGYNILLVDYRGYGKSTGRISENGFYLDAAAAFDHLVSEGFSPKQILIYGRSIGSGVATHLASERACKGLVLESPFCSMGVLANEKFPLFFPSLYLRFRFDNESKLKSIKSPVLLVHGSHDTLIPSTHSQRLYDSFDGKKEIIIVDRGSHNDLNTFSRYDTFLQYELKTFFTP